MLDVSYEAETLPPGILADIDEDRGKIRVRLEQTARLADVVRQLNTKIDQFLSTSDWFQLWKDEIVGRDTPDCPLRVVYVLQVRQPYGVVVKEKRGIVTAYIDPVLSIAQFAVAMTEASKKFLDAGQWFQMYAGEIIDMTPEELTEV